MTRDDMLDWTGEELQRMDTDTSADEIEIKRDPITQFIARKRRYGKQEIYVSSLESILREYEAFLYNEFQEHICNIDDSFIIEFNEHLKSNGKYYVIKENAPQSDGSNKPKKIEISDRTRHDYLRKVGSLYNWLVDVEKILSQNPVEKALEDLGADEFDLSPPGRPKIELHEMRDFLQWLPDPQARAITLFLLKTATRIGEAMNVDLCCLNIEHPLYHSILEQQEIEMESEVIGKPDTVYIMPGFTQGTKKRGEVRKWGNKRKRTGGSVIPLDRELKTSLLEYLLVRRQARAHSSPGKPLFTKRSNSKGESDRMTKSSVDCLLTSHHDQSGYLEEYGWYEQGAPTEENVTFHYFRHYFTHNHKHLRGVYDKYMPKGTRKYIRGDVPDTRDVEDDNYSHQDWDTWERFVKKPYLENVYQFDIYG